MVVVVVDAELILDRKQLTPSQVVSRSEVLNELDFFHFLKYLTDFTKLKRCLEPNESAFVFVN